MERGWRAAHAIIAAVMTCPLLDIKHPIFGLLKPKVRLILQHVAHISSKRLLAVQTCCTFWGTVQHHKLS